jgi:nitrous oxide reductase accessory protein NosL
MIRAMTAASLVLTLLVVGCGRAQKVCAVCNREECTGMAFRVTLENGRVVETCCARCGMHYLESNQQRARAFQATDFATGQWTDAMKAVFVSGSDVRPCATPATRRDAQGCCMYMAYDRCLPSLVAFVDRQAALAFQKEHGGQLVALDTMGAKSGGGG